MDNRCKPISYGNNRVKAEFKLANGRVSCVCGLIGKCSGFGEPGIDEFLLGRYGEQR